jgi:carbon monoxide dehydrogenase subunit G
VALFLAGDFTFHGCAADVWALIFDPAALKELIPGCRRLERHGDIYTGEIILGVASVGGEYRTTVTLIEQTAPAEARLTGEISGPTGTIAGQAAFTLEEVQADTHFRYEGTATISGALGRVSPRFVEGVARTLVQQGLDRLDQRLAPAGNQADERS